jgi:hypothetical protein
MLEQTTGVRMAATESYFIIDDTLCEHVGSLFEYVDRHYDHCDGSYPLAHNLVTSHYLSGAVRMPVHAEVYRRYEDITVWDRFMLKHFSAQEIPTTAKASAIGSWKLGVFNFKMQQEPRFSSHPSCQGGGLK